MKNTKFLPTLLLLVNSMLPCQGFCESKEFENKFNQLLKQELPHTAVGLVVQDAIDGKIIYESRAEENFYPASNTKLFTAAAALKFFGSKFQYQTSILGQLDKVSEKTLKDNLYIVFRGDPSFSSKDLALLFKECKAKGIESIHGNIVVDDKAFDDIPYAPGWTWDSIPWYYSAPVTSIIINENKVRLKFDKPAALYDQIKIEQTDEGMPTVKLQSKVIAVSAEEAEKSCQLNAQVKHNQITLNGCWPIDKTPAFVEIALDDPRLLAKNMIEQALKANGIALTGQITFEKATKNVPAILIKKSPPLKNLLVKVLGDSNNIYTESLTKALGLAYLGQGSFQSGIRAIQEILTNDTRIEFSQLHISDGSGQSRYNLVSPYLISQLLYHMYRDPSFPIYYAALSTSGKTGSLATRMKTKEMTGKVIAKTGTATGTSALSGYFIGQSGKEYLFALLINQSEKNTNALKTFEDKLCQIMVNEPWLDASASAVPTLKPQVVHQ